MTRNPFLSSLRSIRDAANTEVYREYTELTTISRELGTPLPQFASWAGKRHPCTPRLGRAGSDQRSEEGAL